MTDLVIVGSGGFGREVATLIEDLNLERKTWNLLGFWNSDGSKEGSEVLGLPVFSKSELFSRNKLPSFVLGLGFPSDKWKTVKELPKDVNFPTIIHPTVIRSSRVDISQRGVLVTARCILTTDIVVKDFAMLNLACTVGHDSVIGEYASLSPGTHISGRVEIGTGVSMGTGSVVIPERSVGEWSVVGAGSVVISDIPSNVTAVGIPAKVKNRSGE